MSSRDSVVAQNHRRASQVFDNQVHIAIVEKIACRDSARYPRNPQVWPSLITGVAKRPILLIQLQHFGFFVARAGRQSTHLWIHVAAYDDQIEPAVVVGVKK